MVRSPHVLWILMLGLAGWAGSPPAPAQSPGSTTPPHHLYEGNWIGEWHGTPKEGQTLHATISIVRDWRPLCDGRPFNPSIQAPGPDGCTWTMQRVESSPLRVHSRQGDVPVEAGAHGSLILRHPAYGFMSWNARSDLRLSGTDTMRGRWSLEDKGGDVVLRRAKPSFSQFEFTSATTDRVSPGDRDGRVELRFNYVWPQMTPRGNRPRFGIAIYGQNLWGHHVAWVEDFNLEGYRLEELKHPDRRDEVIGVAMSVAVWPGATPGRKTLNLDGHTIAFDFVVNGYPADLIEPPTGVPVPTIDETADDERAPDTKREAQVRIRLTGAGGQSDPGSILRDQPFDIDLIAPAEEQAPKGGKTVFLVLPQGRGSIELPLHYQEGTRWSTASPMTIKDGGGGRISLGPFEFSTILGSSRLTGGVGGLDVRDGEYLTVRYRTAFAEVRVHETNLKRAIALYRDGFIVTQQEMLDRLEHGGFSSTEMNALSDPQMPGNVRDYILAKVPAEIDLDEMKRKLAYANHALRIIDGQYYELDVTRYEIASGYAGLIRYPSLLESDRLPGGPSDTFGFDFASVTERERLSDSLARSKAAKTEAILRGARDEAMGFYQWTIESSGAGDFVMLAGIDPMTGKRATTRQRLETLAKISLAKVTDVAVKGTLNELTDNAGTAGGGRRTDSAPGDTPDSSAAPRPKAATANPPTEMPPVPGPPKPLPGRTAAEPPRAIPPVPDRPAPLPSRPVAEPPATMPPVPDRPAPLPSRPTAEPPATMPPVPDRPAPLPSRPTAEPPATMPPVPDRPAPLPGRLIAEPPTTIPPVPDRPAPLPSRTMAEPPQAIPPVPDRPAPMPRSETVTRPLGPPPGDTSTARVPSPNPARAAREARASLETDRGSGLGTARREVLEELRATTSPGALRRWDETEALVDRVIEANPRLKQIDRGALSTYVGIHAGRRDATPAQLAAEALNYHGGGVTSSQLAAATGLTSRQAEHTLRRGWDAMQVPNVDVNRPPAVRNSSAANVTVPDSRLVTPKLPAPGRGAATILDKLNVPKLDRAKADAYVAAEAGRLGISDAQLAAEAVRSQGIVVTGKALAAAAGLEPLAGNDALRRGLQHLGSSRRVPAAANAAPGADDIALRWKEANDRRERAQAEGARQKQRDLEARIAQAASLPPRPPDAPGPRANMPMRYLVAGDTEYLQRIMGPTPFVPTQVYVEAAKVNRLVDSMLGVRPLPRGFYEPPVRLGPNMEILDGHNRLVAATIVSARTGRPVFESWGPNAILRDPGAPLPAGARQPRGGGWMLKVKP